MFGYADESGEPGIKKNDNDYFVFCIVLLKDKYKMEKIRDSIVKFRERFGLPENHEFHYATDSKKTRKEFATFIDSLDYSCISISIHKNKHQQTASFARMADLTLDALEKHRIDANVIMDINPRLYKELRVRKRSRNINLRFAERRSRGNDLIQLADYVTAFRTRCLKYPYKSNTRAMFSLIEKKILEDIRV